MTDTSKIDKSRLLKNFATGQVPTEDDFAALINLAEHSAAALGMNTADDVIKPVVDGAALGGLQVKAGKLTLVTDPTGPLTVKTEGLTLGYNQAHLEVEADKRLGVRVNTKGGLAIAPDAQGKGLMVNHGQGLALSSEGKLTVNIGSGLAADPKDASKLAVNVGKGLAVDTSSPNALIVNVSKKGGLDFAGTALKIKLAPNSNLTQDEKGLSLTADALKKMAEEGSMKTFREAVSRAYPGHYLNKIPPAAYPDIRTCFEKMFAYAKANNWQKSSIIKGSKIMAPGYSIFAEEFKLLKPDNTVINGEGNATDNKGACTFDKEGPEYFDYQYTRPGFFIAVGSVDDNGNYLDPNQKDTAKLTENALLMFRDDVSISVLGWWDMNVLLAKALTTTVPALETGWQACTPVVLSASLPWETIIGGLYGHQYEIAALKLRLEYILATNTKKRASLSLGLESRNGETVISTSTGERAMTTNHMWVVKSDTLELSNSNLASLDDVNSWPKGCYLFLGETDDQQTLTYSASHFTRNALVVFVSDKNTVSGKADSVRVVGNFLLSEDGKHAVWQPVVQGVIAQGADRFREAMNRVDPTLAIPGMAAEDYAQIRQCFGVAFAFAKEKGFTTDFIIKDSLLVAPAYGGTQTTFSLKKKDGSFVDGEGSSGAYIFDTKKYTGMKYADLPEKFSIAVGSVNTDGDYFNGSSRFTQNALLLYKDSGADKAKGITRVRVLGWWDLSEVLKKTDTVPALNTGWHAWAPVLLDPVQPWDEVISGLYTHEGEIAVLKARLDAIIASDANKHNPPLASLDLEKRGDNTLITSSYGESAMPAGYAWLFKSNSEEMKSPYDPLEKWAAGCYMTFGHTDDNGSFTGTISRFTKNALVIEIGPNPTLAKPDYIRVIGNFLLSADGKQADWQPVVGAVQVPGQAMFSARQALATKLKALMTGHTHTYEFARINVSASTEETLTSFYYGSGSKFKFPPNTLTVYKAGADTADSDMTKWTDGYYAVVASLDATGKTPTNGGPALTANAVMLSKFKDAVSVTGYWDLAQGDAPEWYQTEPDPALYDIVRKSEALTANIEGKGILHHGELIKLTINKKEEVYKYSYEGGNGAQLGVGSDGNTVGFDAHADLLLHHWGPPTVIWVTQPATRYNNKNGMSFSVQVLPKAINTISDGIPAGSYSKEKLDDLTKKFSNVKATEGDLAWESSKPEVLKVADGKLVAGDKFVHQTIVLTAHSSDSSLLEKTKKDFTFVFREKNILDNTLKIHDAAISKTPAGWLELTVVLKAGNSNVPTITTASGDSGWISNKFEKIIDDFWRLVQENPNNSDQIKSELKNGHFVVRQAADDNMDSTELPLKCNDMT